MIIFKLSYKIYPPFIIYLFISSDDNHFNKYMDLNPYPLYKEKQDLMAQGQKKPLSVKYQDSVLETQSFISHGKQKIRIVAVVKSLFLLYVYVLRMFKRFVLISWVVVFAYKTPSPTSST